MNDLVILRVSEWEGLYVNNELKFENHQVEIEQVAKFCPIRTLVSVYITEDSPLDKRVTDQGGFPPHLDDCIHLQQSLSRLGRKQHA